MENIALTRTAGCPMSGGTGAFTFGDASYGTPTSVATRVHQVKQVRRERVATDAAFNAAAIVNTAIVKAVCVQAPITADLLSDPSASTSERRT